MAYTTVYLGDQRCIVADTFAELPTTDDIVIGTPAKVGKNDYALSQDRVWIQTASGGAVNTATTSDSVWSYGNYPDTWFSSGSWDGAGDTQTTIISGVESFNTFTLELHTLTATSITVSISIDGTNYSDARLIDLSTGTVFATNAITSTGIYQLKNMKFSDITLTQAGAGAAEVRYSLGNT